MQDLPKAYSWKEIEPEIYKGWEESGAFKPENKPEGKPFVVTIPPPNVTGVLHMGHALNTTIQDVLVRYHRMLGDAALWVPGTDHAGIATQNKVEQKLAKEGINRHDMGREKFLEEVWKWKEEYQARILGQLKTMGASCDWSRTRFTMDEGYSKAVLKTFVSYYKKGYLYRDYRITNWCPRCSTSLSDLEVEHEERQDFLWHIAYPISGGGNITVATTRPETMLGDTAVAVNPSDDRYKDLVGKTVILPIINREVPIIADELVDKEFGTGAVKVTPAHDPNDFEMGAKHSLAKIIVIDLQGKMTLDAGEEFAGLDRYEAREKIIEMLKEGEWLVEQKPHTHAVGHCYRCNTVIEPSLTMQWWVDMQKVKAPAIEAVKSGKVKLHPSRWAKPYLDWMDGVRDWCISRQIWWGHQIPAWYCEDCGATIVEEETPDICPVCGSIRLRQDEDVLDTWFSSALWPFVVMGWPEESDDMKKYYPTSFLSTARDIMYLWVTRMVFSSEEFLQVAPFKDVYIHPTVFNHEGKRMSKSLGTGVDPLDLVEKYGTDATRFGLLWQTAQGQDMRFSEDALLMAQRFCNKIWNASKFTMMNLDGYKKVEEATVADKFTKEDKQFLTATRGLSSQIEKYLSKYDFQHAVELLYEHFWHEFCDKYIEHAKGRIREGAENALAAQYVLDEALRIQLKLMHPFMPFVTEYIWSFLDGESKLITEAWPK